MSGRYGESGGSEFVASDPGSDLASDLDSDFSTRILGGLRVFSPEFARRKNGIKFIVIVLKPLQILRTRFRKRPFFDAQTRWAEGFFPRVCASKKWHKRHC